MFVVRVGPGADDLITALNGSTKCCSACLIMDPRPDAINRFEGLRVAVPCMVCSRTSPNKAVGVDIARYGQNGNTISESVRHYQTSATRTVLDVEV